MKATNETKEHQVSLGLIRELGLENSQRISEDDLCTVVAALYLKEYQTKLETLLNSKYLKARAPKIALKYQLMQIPHVNQRLALGHRPKTNNLVTALAAKMSTYIV
jgi:hypothetical protein